MGLAILSLISLTLFAGVRSTTRMSDAGEARGARSQTMRLVSSYLEEMLSTTVPVQSTESGRRVNHFAGTTEQLSFIVDGPARFRAGGLVEIAIEGGRADGQDQIKISRGLLHPELIEISPANQIRWRARSEEEGTYDERVILEDAQIQFAYFGRGKDGVEPRWQDEWSDELGLPSLVKVTITSDAHGEWPAIVVRPMVQRARIQRVANEGAADAAADADDDDKGNDSDSATNTDTGNTPTGRQQSEACKKIAGSFESDLESECAGTR